MKNKYVDKKIDEFTEKAKEISQLFFENYLLIEPHVIMILMGAVNKLQEELKAVYHNKLQSQLIILEKQIADAGKD